MLAFTRRNALCSAGAAGVVSLTGAWPVRAQTAAGNGQMQSWPLQTSRRTGIHDVAPAPGGEVWFTAQASGHLGWFAPKPGAPNCSRWARALRHTT